MPNPVVHFEVTGTDGAKLQQFYREAFAWNIDAENPMAYGMVDNDGEGIGGGISGGEASGVTFYIEVADLGEALKKVQSLGGRVVMEITEIPDMVTMAQFADPAGNVIGLVKAEAEG